MVVQSEYAEVNAEHVAYQMVRPEWVIEVSCLDLVSQNTRGGPIGRMVLDWHRINGHSCYRTIRRLPLASVISPQFVRRREDKSVHPRDVRIAQLTDLVEVPQAELDARRLTMPKSEVLRREVFVKELKGETMVRKLVLWKTNKESQADDYPAYVVHLTDFSPNRKDPLARELRVSNSASQIVNLFERLRAENVTKGWSQHSSLVLPVPAAALVEAEAPPPIPAVPIAAAAVASAAAPAARKMAPSEPSLTPAPAPHAAAAKEVQPKRARKFAASEQPAAPAEKRKRPKTSG
jgi:hypothetical protein